MQSGMKFIKNGIDMSIYSELNKEYLHECFLYDGGKLYWKERPLNHLKCLRNRNSFNKRFAGKLAGNRIGRVSLDGVNYYIKKIIWIMFKEEPCPEFIGYKDFDNKNTNIENLLPTYRGETANRTTNTGHRRISRSGNSYLVQFPRHHFSKKFSKLEDAITFTKEKAKELGYHYEGMS